MCVHWRVDRRRIVRGVDRLFKQEKRLDEGRSAGRSAVQTGMTMMCEDIGG